MLWFPGPRAAILWTTSAVMVDRGAETVAGVAGGDAGRVVLRPTLSSQAAGVRESRPWLWSPCRSVLTVRMRPPIRTKLLKRPRPYLAVSRRLPLPTPPADLIPGGVARRSGSVRVPPSQAGTRACAAAAAPCLGPIGWSRGLPPDNARGPRDLVISGMLSKPSLGCVRCARAKREPVTGRSALARVTECAASWERGAGDAGRRFLWCAAHVLPLLWDPSAKAHLCLLIARRAKTGWRRLSARSSWSLAMVPAARRVC